MPEIHAGLRKAESSILTQIRTGRMGLASFLNRAKLLDFPSSNCQCGQAKETAAQIIAYCSRFAEQRRILTNPLTCRQDVKALVSSAAGEKSLVRWFLRLRILPQFLFAEELLRREEEEEEEGTPFRYSPTTEKTVESVQQIAARVFRPVEGFPSCKLSEVSHGLTAKSE